MSKEIAYEEDGDSQALFKIDEVGDHIEITFFEEDETLEFQTLADFINADLSTFKETDTAKEKAKELIEAERQEMEDAGFGKIKIKMSIQSIETCIEEDNIGQAISHTEQLKERLKKMED